MWRYLFLVPAYLLATSLPLVSQVGANLEYEYALLASYLGLVLLPAVALLLPARRLPMEDGQFSIGASFEVFWILFISPLFGLLPGAYAYAMKLCPCSASGFGFWMLVLWYPSWVLAHAVHHGILRFRCRGLPPWKIAAGWMIAYGAMVSVAMIELWVFPQKRIVNLLIGFIHGPIYDDWIAVDHGADCDRSL